MLSHPQALAAVQAVLTEMLGLNEPHKQEEGGEGDDPSDDQSAAEEQEEEEPQHIIKIGGRAAELLTVTSQLVLPGSGPSTRKVEG